MLPGIITGALIVLFLAGWAWAWSPRRKRAFDDAARLPLQDDAGHTGVHKDSKLESPQ
ncbi:MAG TPA: cbb3-type cytochrome c oxidase subunit 3 [Thermomonas sp.]|nr:cbb3-type cytochrome c oxidase subunit 3 [Thermomonas sp.]